MQKKGRGFSKRWVILAVVVLLGLVNVYRWSQRDIGKLKHALKLDKLPRSVRVVGSGGESWTNYLFVADLSIVAGDFPALLKGRDFVESNNRDMSEGRWISGFSPFDVDAAWECIESDSSCIVYTDISLTRVFVRYISD